MLAKQRTRERTSDGSVVQVLVDPHSCPDPVVRERRNRTSSFSLPLLFASSGAFVETGTATATGSDFSAETADHEAAAPTPEVAFEDLMAQAALLPVRKGRTTGTGAHAPQTALPGSEKVRGMLTRHEVSRVARRLARFPKTQRADKGRRTRRHAAAAAAPRHVAKAWDVRDCKERGLRRAAGTTQTPPLLLPPPPHQPFLRYARRAPLVAEEAAERAATEVWEVRVREGHARALLEARELMLGDVLHDAFVVRLALAKKYSHRGLPSRRRAAAAAGVPQGDEAATASQRSESSGDTPLSGEYARLFSGYATPSDVEEKELT